MEFLSPVSYSLKEYAKQLDRFTVGRSIQFELPINNEPKIVLFSIPEYRPDYDIDLEDYIYEDARKRFYQLSSSNWSVPVIDLGILNIADTPEETYFALHNCMTELRKKNTTILIITGSQAHTYVSFKSLLKKSVDLVTIDKRIDIKTSKAFLTKDNYLSKMIFDEDTILKTYCNLGTQVPYNQKETYDLLNQLSFDEIRLGILTKDLSEAEPYLREVDMVSVDLGSLQISDFNESFDNSSNGFSAREICKLMHYIGLNKNLKILSLDNYYPMADQKSSSLIAEMFWYCIESLNNQLPTEDLKVYRIQQEEEIVFYKSNLSEQWWIEIEVDSECIKIPCSEKDYLTALNGDKPDKLLRFYKRYY